MIKESEVKSLVKEEIYWTTHSDEVFGDKGQLTICVLKTYSGFECQGVSGTITPEKNWNEKISRELAYSRAFNELWKLHAYHTQQKKYESERNA